MQKLYPVSKNSMRIAKCRLKLKKVGKTTRPFKYGLNQITYDYTMKVTKRLKGLDLINRVPEELPDLLELTPKKDVLFIIRD